MDIAAWHHITLVERNAEAAPTVVDAPWNRVRRTLGWQGFAGNIADAAASIYAAARLVRAK